MRVCGLRVSVDALQDLTDSCSSVLIPADHIQINNAGSTGTMEKL